MASTKEYRNFILEQLSELDEVSFRAMMGEYILYYRGRVFGGIYDDRLSVKPVPSAVKLMPDAAITKADVVEILKLLEWSPPVPTISSVSKP